MTEIRISSSPTFRDFRGRWAKATEELMDQRSQQSLELGRYVVGKLRDEAPGEKYKHSFRYLTRMEGKAIVTSILMPEPLTGWIRFGTKRHQITVKNAKSLRFFWANGPRGAGIYYFISVMHPGTKPNDFVGRAYAEAIPHLGTELRRISNNFCVSITRD